jgi:hypothetical protein
MGFGLAIDRVWLAGRVTLKCIVRGWGDCGAALRLGDDVACRGGQGTRVPVVCSDGRRGEKHAEVCRRGGWGASRRRTPVG